MKKDLHTEPYTVSGRNGIRYDNDRLRCLLL